MIFLDNASTTRVFSEAAEAMTACFREDYFNPSALYRPAQKVRDRIEGARETVAKRLGVRPDELFFTSGATEANTWAVQSGFKNRKGNVVISAGEHASVYENAVTLKNKGFDVRIVPLKRDGTLDTEKFLQTIDENTSLVSVIHCSNETGAINDLKSLTFQTRKKSPHALFHADGVQAFCKIPFNCADLGVDLYSVSAHKIGGPKGIGALYIRKPIKLSPLIPGGGQEKGSRSGTENVAGIVGFAVAAETFFDRYRSDEVVRCRRIMSEILAEAGGLVNSPSSGSPHILSVSFPGIKSEILQHILSEKGIMIGLGSACSGKTRFNRVLKEAGLPQTQIEGNIRISFGPENTPEEAESAARIIAEEAEALRGKIHG